MSTMTAEDYDFTHMNTRRDEMAALRQRLKQLDGDQTAEVMLAYGLGVTRQQLEIESGYSKNTVWRRTMSPEERDRERSQRRKAHTGQMEH